MGLKNSPSIFQRAMNVVLQEVLGKFAYIYIDDIIVYSHTAEKHLQDIARVLELLFEHGLRIKFSKVQLFKAEIEYLGFLVGRDGLKVNPLKTKAIQDFPTPTDVKGVQAFLGVVGYFRVFIPDFATKARPLYALLKKGISFFWGEDQARAVQEFKLAMQQAPILAFPDFKREFILTTDASGYALGAVLTQEDDNGQERLISCHSRTLKDAETRYNTFDREILAVYWGVEQNRSYLWGSKFVIRTDNIAIPFLERSRTSASDRAIRWFMTLCEYDYRVEHRKGKSIAHADALSRYPHDADYTVSTCVDNDGQVIAYLSPTWHSDELVPIVDTDEWKRAVQKTAKGKLPEGNQVVRRDDLIYIKTNEKELLWVPPSLRTKMVKLYHEPPSQGHRGAQAVSKAMKNDMTWTNLERDVKDIIKSCEACQQFKNYGTKNRPYKTRPVPKRCFDEISMDVVGPVPTSSKGNNYILVIQDRLSRWIQFSPMSNTSALTTSRTFLNDWVCVFGPPGRILTDRGPNFLSSYFRELAKWLGIQTTNTAAYRPQANGQNERTHRELHNYLTMYLNEIKSRTHWDTLLRLAAWVHNSTVHEALKASPYEIMTGMKPNVARMWLPGESESLSEDMLEEHFGIKKEKLEELRRKATEAIERGQAGFLAKRNKSQGHIYQVGELVWVKSHRASKWQARYHGPYKVSKIISDVIVQIILDEEKMKKDLVHVDYLKPYYSRDGSPAVRSTTDEHSSEVTEEITSPAHYFADADPDEVLLEGTSGEHGRKSAEDKMAGPSSPATSPSAESSKETPSAIRSAYRSLRNFFKTPESTSVDVPPTPSEPRDSSGITEEDQPRAEQVIEFSDLPPSSDPPRYLMRTRSAVEKRDRKHEISRADRALLEENIEKGVVSTPVQGRVTRSKAKV
jgi:hypothetical protein